MIPVGVTVSILTNLFSKIHRGDSACPSLDTMLAMFDRELENFQSLVLPTPESNPRTPSDSPDLATDKMSMANISTRQQMTVLPIMLPMVEIMQASSKLFDGKFQPRRSEATPDFIEDLESLAKASGAKDIKFVKVPRNAIFQHPKPRSDGWMQCNHAACRGYFNQKFCCAIYPAECPLSVAGYERVKSKFRGNPSAPQFRIPVATNLEADQLNPVEISIDAI